MFFNFLTFLISKYIFHILSILLYIQNKFSTFHTCKILCMYIGWILRHMYGHAMDIVPSETILQTVVPLRTLLFVLATSWKWAIHILFQTLPFDHAIGNFHTYTSNVLSINRFPSKHFRNASLPSPPRLSGKGTECYKSSNLFLLLLLKNSARSPCGPHTLLDAKSKLKSVILHLLQNT